MKEPRYEVILHNLTINDVVTLEFLIEGRQILPTPRLERQVEHRARLIHQEHDRWRAKHFKCARPHPPHSSIRRV